MMNKDPIITFRMGGSSKITTKHLERLACIYVRQSSLHQVEHNRESRFNQSQLVERAASLGWPQAQIRLIDADLGLSGQHSENRQGFRELVTELSLGHVGIVFGYEVSRLARNNQDWYHLLDLAALFGTLIADNDGIYDPGQYNDRLLLGLKGTMSEAELHLLKQRLGAGRMSKVLRGEHRQKLPTGLIRLPDGTVVKDPDDQVRHIIELILDKFADLGSCWQVLRYLQQEQILVPRRQTTKLQAGELVWKAPAYPAIYEVIRNPAYAGAFVFGQRQVDPTRQWRSGYRTGLSRKPMTAWIHVQQDVYPAYITWEQYQMNQQRLHQNRPIFGTEEQAQGITRDGVALLAGLVWCGHCGARMQVAYRKNYSYQCSDFTSKSGTRDCGIQPGRVIDEVVVQAFFEAIRPAKLDALAAVLAQQQAEQERLAQHWQDRLKRAHYEAHLARRQYDAVDPDNRLVAAELERRWEEKLQQVQEVEASYQRFQDKIKPTQLPPKLQDQLRHISERLPDLWESGQLSNEHKKELIRSLISQVIIKRRLPDRLELKIIWVSGHYTELEHPIRVLRLEDVSGYDQMLDRIQTLWQQGLTDQEIAAQLTQEGYRSAAQVGQVMAQTVSWVRHKHGWYRTSYQHRQLLEVDGYLTIRGLAAQLGVKRDWLYHQLRKGNILAHQVKRHPQSGIYLFCKDPEFIEHLRHFLAESIQSA